MNTSFITRPSKAAGKSLKKHQASIASGSISAMIIAGAMQLGERYLDSKAATSEAQAVEERLNQRFSELKNEQSGRDKAQWEAISKKKDKTPP